MDTERNAKYVALPIENRAEDNILSVEAGNWVAGRWPLLCYGFYIQSFIVSSGPLSRHKADSTCL